NEHGKSIFFEIGMRFVSKADDYLHSLKNNPNVLASSVLFNLFEEWDHFQGYDPENVSVKPINEVSEPAPLLLLVMGIGVLAFRNKRDLSLS
ncbi:MAG TPA: PEP-CTERM sorting domain-containing protein, partial [Cellvibrio sp.]